MSNDNIEKTTEYNQTSFSGGMNLLLSDVRLGNNQYRLLLNGRNRYDRLDLIPSSIEDVAAPSGIKQAMITFGEYVVAFVTGRGYYRHHTSTRWLDIPGFGMDASAPKYWTQPIPVCQTNYVRFAATTTIEETETDVQSFKAANSLGEATLNSIAGAASGNLSGLLVQDNINQPRFIYIDTSSNVVCRTTQSIDDWCIKFTNKNNTIVAQDGDLREYVPIGNAMAFVDGILYIVSPNYDVIYRSVEGRPLDFVVNVTNLLAGDVTTKLNGEVGEPFTQYPGGDASTTSYSVGVGGITCLKEMSDGSLFVGANNASFSVSKNMTDMAPKIFGEWTFIRKFLFNANCLSDRGILDSLGDTKFIDLTGIRSFNAIQQAQGSEGRNSPFTSTIKVAFDGIIQDPRYSAAIIYDDYELYAVNTIFGPAIAVYDTINNCWVGFDTEQCGGKRIKQFVKIELSTQVLYAITEDDKLYQLYANPLVEDEALFRSGSVCSSVYTETGRIANPKLEIKLNKTRVILDNITKDCSFSITPYVNNRIETTSQQTKQIAFVPSNVAIESDALPDAGTQLKNLLFSTPSCAHGWKTHVIFRWTSGGIVQFSFEMSNLTPQNPIHSQT